MSEWMIEFAFDQGNDEPLVCWAGWAGDTLGFAPTPTTAARFPSEEIARRTLANAYMNYADVGSVFEVSKT